MELTVYSAPWCRDCHTAKRWLAQHNITYKEINIEEVPGAAEEVIRQTGKRAIPQFVIDGNWIQPYTPGRGFKYAEMAELFAINGRQTAASPCAELGIGSQNPANSQAPSCPLFVLPAFSIVMMVVCAGAARAHGGAPPRGRIREL